MPAHLPHSRRRFLRELLGASAAASLTPLDSLARGLPAMEAVSGGEILPSYIADTTGNERIGKPDRTLVSHALGSVRGHGIVPAAGYDYRADLFGRGLVDERDRDAVRRTQSHLRSDPAAWRARPITVAWHYGWFNYPTRVPRDHHVWFKGGAYSSRDPEAEATFHRLKNEFGITVDALSWADPEFDGNLNDNLYQGYLRSPDLDTRHVALLYESLISLQPRTGPRADFTKRLIRQRLVSHFAAMAQMFVHVRDQTPARMLWIDGRPVIFVYASHTWGLNVDGTGEQYDLIDATMEEAIAAFEGVFGRPPFLIGEEMTLGLEDVFDSGRRRRSANFDGIFVYHHASGDSFVEAGGDFLGDEYLANVKLVAEQSYLGALGHLNRFTKKRMLVVPSLAAGFSRAGARTLFADRDGYAAFLQEMLRFHHQEYMLTMYGNRAAETPAVVSVGSWNEEWEGHALFPNEFNLTLSPRVAEGFDYVLALKQAFGWNHYAHRRARFPH